MTNKQLFLLLLMLPGLLMPSDTARANDSEFLDKVARDSFDYFWEEANPENGLIRDNSKGYSPSSIASVGFGLTALTIAVERKWIPKNDAYLRILTTLKTCRDRVEHERGFFYHFVSMKSGRRVWESEASSIDTALLIAGALTAGEYFKGTEIEQIANELYERVDWPWMLNGQRVLCMGWKPENGFLAYYWNTYSELMILYALAIGSPTHPIQPASWHSWTRQKRSYAGTEFIWCPSNSLFVHQYSHAWIDFRGKKDRHGDYWDNSVRATLTNRQFCIDNAERGYSEHLWGLSACVGPNGYRGYGGGPGTPDHDGTIAPSAVAGSVPFLPAICIGTLRHLFDTYGSQIYGKYGFKNGINVNRKWVAEEFIGIDQGITLLMIENHLSGFVWEYFMRHPAVQKWHAACLIPDK